MSIKNWSTDPSLNTSAPPYGAPEGMTLASVNNVMRQMMADTRQLAAIDTIASATTTDLGSKDATFLTVTGTNTITSFGTVSDGIYKFLMFSGSLTLTHNTTSLVLPGDANIRTESGDTALFLSLGSGNWRCISYNKKNDYVANVRWYGAVGDGATDDSAAIQAALNTANVIYFPEGTYYIGSTLSLPNKNMTLIGTGHTSKIVGSVSPLVEYHPSFNTYFANIYNLSFDATGDNISVKMHGVWTASGKVGPTISGCYFYNSSATTTTAKCISISGVWTASIKNNTFMGTGSGETLTTGIGGYGIYLQFGDDFNTSVMNLNISENSFTTLAFPYWCSNRTIADGGRVEGIIIANNKFTAGHTAIRSSQGLATNISGNLISNFYRGIDLQGEFGFVINGNTEIDGQDACIKLSSVASGFCEKGSISGNVLHIRKAATIGINLVNDFDNERVRAISVTGNCIGAVPMSGNTRIGIKFEGSYSIDNISITGNSFYGLNKIVDVSPASMGSTIVIVGNSNSNIINNFTVMGQGYAKSIVVTLTGGAATEIVDIPIPSGVFFKPPVAGYCTEQGGASTHGIIGIFHSNIDDTNTTQTNARFTLRRLDGSNIPTGNVRLNIYLSGQ